MDKITSV